MIFPQINKSNKGFTAIEVLVVLAIFSALIGYTVINLFGSREKSNIFSSMSSIISDIKHQQQSAMSGEGGTDVNYGVYFTGDSYVLFKGDTFSLSDPSNFTVKLSDNIRFDAVDFQDSVLIFSYGSGEVYNFNPLLNSFKLINTLDDQEKTIYINKYGSIALP